ncbi:MAG: M1 family metallopeptidase, partial [Chloroflexi bacterium]|nr:M1 family metallopeptidase [Chloroflexota bacterium]
SPLAQPLAPGAVADISLIYGADVPRQTRQGYNIFSASDHTLALAGFYPAIAVYDETGWDTEIPPPYGDATYLDVSLYRVELTVPEQWVVAASGSLLEATSNPDHTKTLSLASGPMRDFYIAAREDFSVTSETVDGTVVNSYYPPDLADGGKLALRYAADALLVYNQRFGPYPYAEFDVAATPTTAGGVEYPGIVVVSQQYYNNPGDFFQFATAHEVAHQWWYGLVGSDQVDAPWLDESLTNYSAALYWEAMEGPESAKKFIDTVFVGPYEHFKSQGRDRAVVGPVADFSMDEYGAIVYGKGPLFFNALRREVGDETYIKIMQAYYIEYKYKIAQPDDLFSVIERVSGRNVEPLVETWLENSVVP